MATSSSPRTAAALLLSVVTLSPACVGTGPHGAQAPRHHDDSDDELYDRQSFPEPTTRPPRDPGAPDALPSSGDPARPNVKVELTVVDVISWDEVKIRGGIRGSVVRGVVSLTGWLSGEKAKGAARSKTTQFVVVQAGHEASISLSDPAVRELVGPYAALRVAVIEATPAGEVDVAVDPLAAPDADGGQMTLATRVHVGAGEALVVGGHRSEGEGEEQGPGGAEEGKRRHDQLAILKATVVR